MSKCILWIATILHCTAAFSPGGFRMMTHSLPETTPGDLTSELSSVTRSGYLKQLGTTSAGIVGASVWLNPHPGFATGDLAATKRSYFRYVPRIVEGLQWYQDDLQKAVLAEDWPKVLEFFELVNTASTYSQKPTIYQSSSSRFERDLFSPMSLWAQSFAIKGVGPKLKALQEQETILEDSMQTLEKVVRGKGLKEGQSQGQLAKSAWTGGKDAIQSFMDIANDAMPRQLNKVVTPFSKG